MPITVTLYQIVPRHNILRRIIYPKSEPGQLSYKKIKPLPLENQKGHYLRNRDIRGNAHVAIHLRTINRFLKLVYLYVKIAANIVLYVILIFKAHTIIYFVFLIFITQDPICRILLRHGNHPGLLEDKT